MFLSHGARSFLQEEDARVRKYLKIVDRLKSSEAGWKMPGEIDPDHDQKGIARGVLTATRTI
jgi:hypothetical protein